ncbi:hypothetical protein E4T56_gene18426 [Termitomyces sp. T112]|nr:hypothetical protein E4T56_gene18426 [Termitomyces sp. T112]
MGIVVTMEGQVLGPRSETEFDGALKSVPHETLEFATSHHDGGRESAVDARRTASSHSSMTTSEPGGTLVLADKGKTPLYVPTALRLEGLRSFPVAMGGQIDSLMVGTQLRSGKDSSCRAHGCKCTEMVFVQAAHTAAPSDVGEANDEQEEEPAEADTKDVFESNGTQEHDEEYIELEIYNKYYTRGSDSEGLFALTKAPIGKHREKEPSNMVCMLKVWLVTSKDAMECPVLLA